MHSKTAIKILLGFSLLLSVFLFLCSITGLFAEPSGSAGIVSEILNSRVLVVLLSLLIVLTGIGLLIFLKPLITQSPVTQMLSGREDELMREGLLGEEPPKERQTRWDILAKVTNSHIGGESVPLASSYNKMVETLQKVNEMEKRHSVELADANRKLHREITERERAEKEIRYLSRKLINGIEEAQKKLARDLHDEFGQTLAALHLNAEALSNSMPPENKDQKRRIEEVTVLIEQLGDKIRNISSDLRPDLLDDLGLVPTLEWYIKEFHEKRKDIRICFQAVGLKKRLSPDFEIVLYRLFQESLNNVVKHAKADQVDVMLTYNYPKAIFVVRDNGVGFDEQTRHSKGIGLIGMRERVVSLNGTVEIRSAKGKGTTIRAELPVSHEQKEAPPNGK